MVAAALVYMSPVFEGKTLPQGDVIHAQDQIQDVVEFQEETGEYPGWTNSAFAGMPTYQLKSPPSKNIFHYLFRIFKLYLPGYTAAILFVAFFGFYFLLRTLKLDRWLALAGALAFGLGAHNLQLIVVGHVSKIYAMAYMAPVIAGMFLVFKKKYLAGGLLTAIGLGIQLSTNHVQVTYYLGLMILVYLLVELVYAIRQKYLDHFIRSGLVLFAALILAILPNMTMLLTTYEYTQETTRGKSAAVSTDADAKSGLDVTYMTDWSYGIEETLNLFIPNLNGGGGATDVGEDSEFYRALQRMGYQPGQAKQAASAAPTYWGSQPFTAGPHYVGAIVVFLAILALFLIRGPKKWWLIIVIALSIMLAWGKNFMFLTEFFAQNVPLYDKFRDMTNNLIIAQFAIPLLAFVGIRAWFMDEKRSSEEKLKKLYIGTGIAGGIAVLVLLVPTVFGSFIGANDSAYPADLAEALRVDRISLARKDAFRSLVFVLLAAGILWASLKTKMKPVYLYSALALLILLDLWSVDRRYLNSDRFVNKSQLKQNSSPLPADQAIMADTKLGFRVLDISGPNPNEPNPYKYSRASRFHQSLGGYHAAKLGRYQDVIEKNLYPEMFRFMSALNEQATIQSVTDSMAFMSVHHMLNTNYIILNPQQRPLQNPYTLGAAWFADHVTWVSSGADELAALNTTDLTFSAIVHDEFKDLLNTLPDVSPAVTEEKIELTDQKPNYMKYTAEAGQDRLAVFSSIWYPHGWTAKIDGQPAEYLRANYLLRAMVVPAGTHTIEFEFKSNSLQIGQTVAAIGSILILLFIGVFVWFEYRKKKA